MLMNQVMKSMAAIVYEYEGHIDKFTGDGLMALFGAPVAHENDPERAVRAALTMQSQLQQLPAGWGDTNHKLTARIGINTGTVIAGRVGADFHMEYTVIGDTVNLASRLEEATEPNTILVSTATYQRTRPIFNYQQIKDLTLKGKADRLHAYRPLGLRHRPGQTRGLPGLQAPMIGRQEAFIQLQTLLEHVIETSQSQVALITGDAGVGKSRLMLEMKTATPMASSSIGVSFFEGRGLAYARTRPYWMMADLLRSMIGTTENEPAGQQITALTNYLNELGLWIPNTWPYLAHLIGLKHIDVEAELRLKMLDGNMLQKLTFTALRRLILTEAQIAPTILILEDLHWADATSLDFWYFLLQSITDSPLLFVFVSRDEHNEQKQMLQKHITHPQTQLLHIPLNPLSTTEGQNLIEHLLNDTAPQLAAIKTTIAQRSGGNPFFIEELIRILMDEGGLIPQEQGWAIQPQIENSSATSSRYPKRINSNAL